MKKYWELTELLREEDKKHDSVNFHSSKTTIWSERNIMMYRNKSLLIIYRTICKKNFQERPTHCQVMNFFLKWLRFSPIWISRSFEERWLVRYFCLLLISESGDWLKRVTWFVLYSNMSLSEDIICKMLVRKTANSSHYSKHTLWNYRWNAFLTTPILWLSFVVIGVLTKPYLEDNSWLEHVQNGLNIFFLKHEGGGWHIL